MEEDDIVISDTESAVTKVSFHLNSLPFLNQEIKVSQT
jgi:hypothetical protein